MEKNITKYVICLRWYMVVNYIISVAEQIALWHYGFHFWFWAVLFFNVISFLVLGSKISRLEKEAGLY